MTYKISSETNVYFVQNIANPYNVCRLLQYTAIMYAIIFIIFTQITILIFRKIQKLIIKFSVFVIFIIRK